MNLLLTNDDGYGAPGLEALKERLLKDGHTVYVMAPDGNRSGVSHGMTFASLDFKKINDREWTCSGKPVDCVVSALEGNVFGEKIDAVLSGINSGFNVGTDIVYSGTCGAARQAVMWHVPGIALSIEPAGQSSYVDPSCVHELKFDYRGMADFTAKNLELLVNLARTEVPQAFVNVNGISAERYTKAEICNRISHKEYNDTITFVPAGEGNRYRSVFKGDQPVAQYIPGTDYYCASRGNISVTLVYAEPASCAVDGISFSL